MDTQKIFVPAALIAVLASSWFLFSSQTQTSGFSETQKSEIHKIIREYLIANPEVLVEVSQAWQKKALQEQSEKAQKAVSENADKLLQSTSPALGNPKGEIVMVKFIDYQCSHCKTMEPVVSALIKENPSLKVIIKELPIFGAQSEYAAKAALAASKQDKFAPFHHALLTEKEKLSNEKILELAKANGLDVEKLKKDLEDPVYAEELKRVKELAGLIAIRGTPFFVILKSKPGTTDQAVIMPGAGSKEQLQLLIDKVKGTAQ